MTDRQKNEEGPTVRAADVGADGGGAEGAEEKGLAASHAAAADIAVSTKVGDEGKQG